MNTNVIFNLRIWKIHIQMFSPIRIKLIFKWFDLWIGLYFDCKDRTTYLFLFPTIGFKINGFIIQVNSAYNWKKDPFIWLFNIGKKYFPMRDYNVKL